MTPPLPSPATRIAVGIAGFMVTWWLQDVFATWVAAAVGELVERRSSKPSTSVDDAAIAPRFEVGGDGVTTEREEESKP